MKVLRRLLTTALLTAVSLTAGQLSVTVSALNKLLTEEESCCCGDPSQCHCNAGCCNHGPPPTAIGSGRAAPDSPVLVPLVQCDSRDLAESAMDRGPGFHDRFTAAARFRHPDPPHGYEPAFLEARASCGPDRRASGSPRAPPEA